MIEKNDGIDAVVVPSCLPVQESLKVVEIDRASPAEMESMLVTTGFGSSSLSLFGIEVDCDAIIVAIKSLAGPSELVAIPDPEISRLTEGGLDGIRVPDLLEKNALGVIEGITSVVQLKRS